MPPLVGVVAIARITTANTNAALLPQIPAGLDLTGSTVVLTHPRTGSSLLMQTLRLLGAEISGDAERPGLPVDANPRGYYENEPVLINGLRARPLAAEPTMLRGRAFKLSLSCLVARADPEEWRRLRQPEVQLLMPIRSPLESLRSQQVFLLQPKEQARRSLHHLAAVRQHLLAHATLTRWVTSPDFRRPAPVFIDYPLALNDPATYVARVAQAAHLSATDAQRAAALANIDRSLHRFTSSRVRAEQPAAQNAEVLEEIYRLQRLATPEVWTQLDRLLPDWARESASWLDHPLERPAHG